MRLKLFEQLGVEVGLKMSNYADLKDYAADLRTAIAFLREKKGGERALIEIGKRIGLDKLGLTVDQVVGAIDDLEVRTGKPSPPPSKTLTRA